MPPAALAGEFRAVMLASLGGAVEFYDFVIYGVFAPAIATTFFPAADKTSALLGVFVLFAAGYLIRPLGGLVFGHIGDRSGRRMAFLISLLGISAATAGMALIPGYASWGIAGTVGFVLLRLIQGMCLGGELPAALTYVVEAAPRRAGLVCGVLFCCVSLGVILATGVNAALHALLPAPAVALYGWRIAFGLGSLIGFASYLPRRMLMESPVFQRIRARAEAERAPIFILIHDNWKPLLIGFATTAIVASYNSFMFALLPAYLMGRLGWPAPEVASAQFLGLVLNTAGLPLAGYIADRVPPHRLHRLGTLILIAAGFGLFPVMVGHSAPLWIPLALLGVAGTLTNGSFAVLLADLFPSRIRFSGVAVAYNLSFALFGGLTPYFATLLTSETGDPAAPGFYLAATAALALLAGFGVRRFGGALAADRAALPGPDRQ
ncbi:MAG TPA: MFS transporter [Aliidongia sp.]|nr:MFS transporter [Aliidongia sp.]